MGEEEPLERKLEQAQKEQSSTKAKRSQKSPAGKEKNRKAHTWNPRSSTKWKRAPIIAKEKGGSSCSCCGKAMPQRKRRGSLSKI